MVHSVAYYSRALARTSTIIIMPSADQKEKQQDDYVPPKDAADAKAREYEDKYVEHTRAGHDKTGDKHSAKPSSVRNA